MVGIYKITNQITGDFYIGKSNNIQKRFYNHKHYVKHSEYFDSDIHRYGWNNFKLEVLEQCTEDVLLEREAYYIQALNPAYNSIVRGRFVSEETRKKISQKLTGIKQPKDVVERRKESIRKRHLTIPQTNAGHRKKVLVDMMADNIPPAEFESVKAAAEFFEVHPSTITHAIKRGHKVHGHPVWYAV